MAGGLNLIMYSVLGFMFVRSDENEEDNEDNSDQDNNQQSNQHPAQVPNRIISKLCVIYDRTSSAATLGVDNHAENIIITNGN